MSGKIIATQYISLDGVIEDPVGMENSGLGDWTGPFSRGPVGDKFKEDELAKAEAIILSRRTYDGFAAIWPTMKNQYADRMNPLPKYLASRTVTNPAWSNTTLFGPDLAASVSEVKNKASGIILIYGSASVCHRLMLGGLIDEFTLIVYPVVLGRGVKLFPDGAKSALKLIENIQLGDGLVLLHYATAD